MRHPSDSPGACRTSGRPSPEQGSEGGSPRSSTSGGGIRPRLRGAGLGLLLFLAVASPLGAQEGRPFGRVGRDRPFGSIGNRGEEEAEARPFGRLGSGRSFGRLGRDRPFGGIGRDRPFGGADELSDRGANGTRREPWDPGEARRYGRVIVLPGWWTSREAEWDLGPRSQEPLRGEVEAWWRENPAASLGPVRWERPSDGAGDPGEVQPVGDFPREFSDSLEAALDRGDLAVARAFALQAVENPGLDPDRTRWFVLLLTGDFAVLAADVERALEEESAVRSFAPRGLHEVRRGLGSPTLRLHELAARADADQDPLFLAAAFDLWSGDRAAGLRALERLRLEEPDSPRVSRLERVAVPWLRATQR